MLELARSEDFEAVNALASQIHRMHVAWRPDIFRMADPLYSQERFAAAIKERQLYVAKISGIPVGYALLMQRVYDLPSHMPRRVMVIDEFGVDELVRNRGIGSQMMMEIRVLARAFGCTDLQLGVYPQNDAAVSFYQKCGFMIRSIDMQCKV